MMKNFLLACFALVGASAFAGSIDDFMTGSYNSGDITSGSVSAWTSAASATGGTRYTDLTITSNPFSGTAKTRVITTPGILQVSTDDSVDTTFLVGYGFANNSSTPGSNPLGQNWSLNPIIDVTVRTNDISQPVVATIYTNGGANSYTRTLNLAGGITAPAPVDYLFDFTSVAGNLGHVDAVTLTFDPAPGADFSLTSVTTVPEPMSFAVLSVGVLALLRRKKK